MTLPYDRRTTQNWIDFLNAVEQWVPQSVERIYAILDNLAMHRATDVLLFALKHPRWEFVFQPTYAAYLNLIEPWWKTLRSLALKGRRFETWEQVCYAGAWAIGMLIVILSYGDAGAVTARVGHLGSLSQRMFVDLVDAPLSTSC